ncbi:imm11 family protein [Litchfieldia salsa]|uniref:Immunity MXAN-0049 protein domain-containing protein n=1 Tax=Litchfieldia salsa TaxID=930152 RepID=A0A1H0PXI3_9BACI|nr:DUF1629 domain-containing protein [Litchfieldia salsa]SDP09425.1 hypothetical protein SAMN05216565_101496 [Litchfieldia salsa]
MKVWQLTRQFDKYEVFTFLNDQDSELFSENFLGEPMKEKWRPIQVKIYSKGKESDSPDGLLLAPLFSEKAVEVLRDFLLGEKVELLSFTTLNGKPYYAMNVINVLDSIDGENSEVVRTRRGRILSYERFAFLEEKVIGQDIFKVLNHESKRVISSKVFVSDQFRRKVLESNLEGFDFIEVWDSTNVNIKSEYLQQPLQNKEVDDKSTTYSFDEASKIAENQNKTFVSDKWAIRFDEDREFQIGQLQEDGSYNWVNPIYYPPIFIGMKWKES